MRFGLVAALGGLLGGCDKPADTPQTVANNFLREVKRDNCAKAWVYFSGPSMEKIRMESAQAIKHAPYYAEQFKPENLYCQSTFAGRFSSMVPGSARPGPIEGSNATVIVQRREPTGFALPGFSPMGSKKVPDEILLVQERGAWKIDVVRPTAVERTLLAARNKAIEREQAMIRARYGTNDARLEK